jgi:hypothetical protein
MARKRRQGNGQGSVYERKNKQGKVIGYRGAYFGPDGKRRLVSGKTKTETWQRLRRAMADSDAGLAFEAGSLTVGKYLQK